MLALASSRCTVTALVARGALPSLRLARQYPGPGASSAAAGAFYLREAPLLRQSFAAKPPRLVECDDGIVNYSLDVPAMSNRLALDREGLDARRGNRLYTLAYERGFNCVSSLVYQPSGHFVSDRSPDAARRYANALVGDDLSDFDFNLAYLTPNASFAIVCGHKR